MSSSSLEPRKRLASQILPSPFPAYILTIAHDDLSAQENGIWHALNPHTFVGRVVNTLILGTGPDGHSTFRVAHDQIGVTTRVNRTLRWDDTTEVDELGTTPSNSHT